MDRRHQEGRTYAQVFEELSTTNGQARAKTLMEEGAHLLLPDETLPSFTSEFLNLLYTKQIIGVQKLFIAGLKCSFSDIDISPGTLAASIDQICRELDLDMKKVVGFTVNTPVDTYYMFSVLLVIAAATGKSSQILSSAVLKCAGIQVSNLDLGAFVGQSEEIVNAILQHASIEKNLRKKTGPTIKLDCEEALSQGNNQYEMHRLDMVKKKYNRLTEKNYMNSMFDNSLQRTANRFNLENDLTEGRNRLFARTHDDALALFQAPEEAFNRSAAFVSYVNNLSLRSLFLRVLKLNTGSEPLNAISCQLLTEIDQKNVNVIVEKLYQSTLDTPQHFTIEAVRELIRRDEGLQLVNENQRGTQLVGLVRNLETHSLALCSEYLIRRRDTNLKAIRNDQIVTKEMADFIDKQKVATMAMTVISGRQQDNFIAHLAVLGEQFPDNVGPLPMPMGPIPMPMGPIPMPPGPNPNVNPPQNPPQNLGQNLQNPQPPQNFND